MPKASCAFWNSVCQRMRPKILSGRRNKHLPRQIDLFYFQDLNFGTACDSSCSICSGPSSSECLTCSSPLLYAWGSCVSTCPTNTLPVSARCTTNLSYACSGFCTSCTSTGFCTGCAVGRSLINGSCSVCANQSSVNFDQGLCGSKDMI